MLLQTSKHMLPRGNLPGLVSQVTLLLLSAKRPRHGVNQLHVTCDPSIRVTWSGVTIVSWQSKGPNPPNATPPPRNKALLNDY